MPSSLADRYRQMPRERLLQIAVHEADGLTPEALAVLHAELESRGADPRLTSVVNAQTRTLSDSEIGTIARAIQAQPCPRCGGDAAALNAGIIASARGMGLFSTYDEEVEVACPACIERQARAASAASAVGGWWALPMGPVHTVRALRQNARTLREAASPEPTDALLEFVETQPGAATALAQGAAA